MEASSAMDVTDRYPTSMPGRTTLTARAGGAGQGRQLAVDVEVGGRSDDPGSELGGVGGCELVMVMEVADVVDDPAGLGGEGVVGEGGDPGGTGFVDWSGAVPVERLLGRLGASCGTEFAADGDELLVECFLLGW